MMENRVDMKKILEIVTEKLKVMESRLDNMISGIKTVKACLKELKEIVKSKVIAEEDTEMNQSSEEEVKRAVIDEEYTSITL